MINGFRFIIGNGCNYNCFYCHHEGITKADNPKDCKNRIDFISKYAHENNIFNLSITGGEPFLYSNKVLYMLDCFNDPKFRFSINTNATLIAPYIEKLKQYKCQLEFHINVSSLQKETHKKITGTNMYEQLFKNIKLISDAKLKVCFNTILLKGINSNEICEMLDFCKKNGYQLRLLQYLPASDKDKELVINEKDLKSLLKSVEICDINSYGIFKCKLNNINFEFVKNLCCDQLCDRCKKYTFIHFTPAFDIKMCMSSEELIKLDYSDYNNFKNILDKF